MLFRSKPEVSEAASKLAAIPGVRRALVAKQQELGSQTSVVMEGRDIGSVVFPDAASKFFLTASAAARAQRRYKQLIEKGSAAILHDLQNDLEERDRRDAARSVAPLRQLPDAVLVDTTDMAIDEAVSFVLENMRGTASRKAD